MPIQTSVLRTALAAHYGVSCPFVAVATTVPGVTAGAEVSGGGYTRQASNWGAAAAASITASPASFSIPGGVTVRGVNLMSAATGGTYVDGVALTAQAFTSPGTYTTTVTYTHGGVAPPSAPAKIAGGLVVVDPTRLSAVSGQGVDHIVMKTSSGAAWSAIEPTEGNYQWSIVYDYLNAYPDAKITLRIQAGEDAPGWLKTATGTVGVYNNSRGANVICCLWWTSRAMNAWQAMINAAGAEFDSNPRVVMVSADLPMSVYSEPFILGSDTQTGINLFNLGCNQTTQTAVIKRCVNDTAAAFPNTLIELAIHSDMQIPISTGIQFSWPIGRQILIDLAIIHGEHLVFSDYGLDENDTLAAHTPTGTITTEPDVYAWMYLRANGSPAAWAGPVSYQLTVGTHPQTQATYVNAAQNAIALGGQMCETAGWALVGSEATRLDQALKAKAAARQ